MSLLVICTLLGWHPLQETLTLAVTNDQYTQILIILPVSSAFIYLEWKSVRKLGKPGARPGIVLISFAVAIAIFARILSPRLTTDMRLAIEMFAVVTSWIGSFVLCFGPTLSRLLLFPLGFLYWLVPIPLVILNEIIKVLQQGSAIASRTLFALATVPVVQDGTQLTIPGLTLEIAKECSSIRSSLMLTVTAMVLAQLFLRSPLRKFLAVTTAVLLSIAKNGLRIFTIAMLGTKIDPGYLTGNVHRHGGIVFFLAALVVVFLLIRVLERTEKRVLETGSLNTVPSS